MKTVAEWNAHQLETWRPPPPLPLVIPSPEPLGVSCPCGAELHTDPGVFWGFKPACAGVKCLKCPQRGYVEDWMRAPKITLVGPDVE